MRYSKYNGRAVSKAAETDLLERICNGREPDHHIGERAVLQEPTEPENAGPWLANNQSRDLY